MSDEESSSASDVDYIPSDAEDVSVEENSGDEENLGESGDESLLNKSLKRKRKTGPALPARKRRGGIRLEDELPDGCEADPETLRLDEERRQKQKEQMVENLRQHEEKEKKKIRLSLAEFPLGCWISADQQIRGQWQVKHRIIDFP